MKRSGVHTFLATLSIEEIRNIIALTGKDADDFLAPGAKLPQVSRDTDRYFAVRGLDSLLFDAIQIRIPNADLRRYGGPGPKLTESEAVATVLDRGFSMTEIDSVLFEMNLDFEEFNRSTRTAYVVDVAKYCLRRNRIDEIMTILANKRPHLRHILDDSNPDSVVSKPMPKRRPDVTIDAQTAGMISEVLKRAADGDAGPATRVMATVCLERAATW